MHAWQQVKGQPSRVEFYCYRYVQGRRHDAPSTSVQSWPLIESSSLCIIGHCKPAAAAIDGWPRQWWCPSRQRLCKAEEGEEGWHNDLGAVHESHCSSAVCRAKDTVAKAKPKPVAKGSTGAERADYLKRRTARQAALDPRVSGWGLCPVRCWQRSFAFC